jgi:hypothetical protein
MMNLTALQFEQASHFELVMVVRLLLAQVEFFEKGNQLLREEIERLNRKN